MISMAEELALTIGVDSVILVSLKIPIRGDTEMTRVHFTTLQTWLIVKQSYDYYDEITCFPGMIGLGVTGLANKS